MHGKGVITIKHLHPGNGNMLEHVHSFGVYVIDQVEYLELHETITR